MKNIVVTGSKGFIGRNLICWLSELPNVKIIPIDVDDSHPALLEALEGADFLVHLAGINRPEDPSTFKTGNADLTEAIVKHLRALNRSIPVLLSSSIQALLNNPYGLSKSEAESSVLRYSETTGAPVFVFRLPNVFGKWCRPNYNSVVATFCHNIANGLPLIINNPDQELQLVHIDDVVSSFLMAIHGTIEVAPDQLYGIDKIFNIRLQDLATRISGFPDTRQSRELPNIGDELTRLLYTTYLSYLPADQFSYPLEMKHDPRGWLAEFIRTPGAGQIFVSVTKPGITRGNHWHHSKTEKFLVLQGEALITFRAINGTDVLEYPVNSSQLVVVDIPPGYTHAITNVGALDVITLFWASEPFDPKRPDTFALPV